jgi:hypothetical protein
MFNQLLYLGKVSLLFMSMNLEQELVWASATLELLVMEMEAVLLVQLNAQYVIPILKIVIVASQDITYKITSALDVQLDVQHVLMIKHVELVIQTLN